MDLQTLAMEWTETNQHWLIEVPIRIGAYLLAILIARFILHRMIEQGLIPDDVEEALAVQQRLLLALQQEQAVYGRFLYIDRDNHTLLRIGFGKHTGSLLRDVPTSYLRWMLQKIPDLPALVASEIRVYA